MLQVEGVGDAGEERNRDGDPDHTDVVHGGEDGDDGRDVVECSRPAGEGCLQRRRGCVLGGLQKSGRQVVDYGGRRGDGEGKREALRVDARAIVMRVVVQTNRFAQCQR